MRIAALPFLITFLIVFNDKCEAAVRQIAAGAFHSVALLDDGSVRSWGANFALQSIVPFGVKNITQVEAGFAHSLALSSDGAVSGWGAGAAAIVPAGLPKVAQIAAAANTSFAVLTDGTVRVWGTQPGLLVLPAGLVGVRQIVAGASHAVALLADGSVIAWGGNALDAPEVDLIDGIGAPPGVAVVSAYAGDSQTYLVLANGTLFYAGQRLTAPPASLSNIVQIAAGPVAALALVPGGALRGWGANTRLQLSLPMFDQSIRQLAIGTSHAIALLDDGTVRAWGSDLLPDGTKGTQSTVPAALLIPRPKASTSIDFVLPTSSTTSKMVATAAASTRGGETAPVSIPTVAIIAGVLGGILLVAIVAVGVLLVLRRGQSTDASPNSVELAASDNKENGPPAPKPRKPRSERAPIASTTTVATTLTTPTLSNTPTPRNSISSIPSPTPSTPARSIATIGAGTPVRLSDIPAPPERIASIQRISTPSPLARSPLGSPRMSTITDANRASHVSMPQTRDSIVSTASGAQESHVPSQESSPVIGGSTPPRTASTIGIPPTPPQRASSLLRFRSTPQATSSTTAFEVPSAEIDIKYASPLGESAAGVSFRGTWRGDELTVTLLRTNDPTPDVFRKTMDKLCSLRHENLDPVLGYSLSPPLILQPPRDPSLENHLSTEPNVAKTLTNLISVARALAFLHANGISHGALTPNSILIPPNAPSRITGFGLCPLQNPASRHEQPRFVAPELLSGEPPQPASDSYALAMVLHQVLARHPPFEGLKPAEVIYQVLVEEERPERPEGLSNGLWEIVEGGWKQEPAKRLSLAEMGARLEDIVKTM